MKKMLTPESTIFGTTVCQMNLALKQQTLTLLT